MSNTTGHFTVNPDSRRLDALVAWLRAGNDLSFIAPVHPGDSYAMLTEATTIRLFDVRRLLDMLPTSLSMSVPPPSGNPTGLVSAGPTFLDCPVAECEEA